jgi:dTDP-4-dehydrorhamnose reductase
MVVGPTSNRRYPPPYTMDKEESKMNLLVTGASGLLGSKLTYLATKKGYEVFSAYNQNIPKIGTPLKLDITNLELTAPAFGKADPDVVIHAAALTNVDKCETCKEHAWRINVQGTKNISELCEQHQVYMIFISTDYIFSGEQGDYRETDPPSPINYYGKTKLEAEQYVQKVVPHFCIARTAVLYGATPARGKTNFALWLLEKLRREEKVQIVTDQKNSPTLNTNLADMLLETIKQRLTGIYHLTGATALSRYNFAVALAKTFKFKTELIQPALSKDIGWIAPRPKNSSLNIAKATQQLKTPPLNIHMALLKLQEELL